MGIERYILTSSSYGVEIKCKVKVRGKVEDQRGRPGR